MVEKQINRVTRPIESRTDQYGYTANRIRKQISRVKGANRVKNKSIRVTGSIGSNNRSIGSQGQQSQKQINRVTGSIGSKTDQ